MKTILVPVDFSPISKQVLKEAAVLARLASARLVLLNVIAPPYVGTDFYGFAGENLVTIAAAAEMHSARHLARLKQTLEQAALPTETNHLTGYPLSVILDQADKLEADYIVIGSHGHTAFYDLFIGSVATGVLRGARCPVLIVPPAKTRPRR